MQSRTRDCAKPSVEVVAGAESATFSLAKCDGSALGAGVDQLSILARPSSAPKPKVAIAALAKTHGAQLAPGVRRIDARLVERLELAVDHFRKDGQVPRISLVSGYRPTSGRSYHASGKALDFRIDGVSDEALVAFCKTLRDTGCGYYPNSQFVHMDVRESGAGHVSWIDISRPGERPHYVSAWPAAGDAGDPASRSDGPGSGSSVPAARSDAKSAASGLPALPNEQAPAAMMVEPTNAKGSRAIKFF